MTKKTLKELEDLKKSNGKRLEDLNKLNALYRKYQGVMKARYNLAPFNEPVLQLERQNGTIEFYDNATSGVYTFDHTDGTRRHLTLKGFPKTMKFYNLTIKVWTCHEDYPFQVPQHPLVDSEIFTMSKDKDLNDTVNYKAKELTAKGKMIAQIAIGIAIIIGVVVLGLMLLPDLFAKSEVITPVAETVNQTARNLTTTIIQ